MNYNLKDQLDENWINVIGFEGLYQISNQGRVKSLQRMRKNTSKSHCAVNERIIFQFISKKEKNAYPSVSLWKNNKRYQFHIHKLVALHFLKRKPKVTVNHKDGIKTNNYVYNLEWATYGENNIHAHQTGLMNPVKGINVHCAKLNEKKVRQIRDMLTRKIPQRKIATIMGVSRGPIQRIAENKGWKHII